MIDRDSYRNTFTYAVRRLAKSFRNLLNTIARTLYQNDTLTPSHSETYQNETTPRK
jgi:hypothetical protein